MIDLEYYHKICNEDSDPSLAVYMVRDFPEVAKAGLDEMAWDLSREHCNKKDALYFFELLEKAVTE